MDLRVSPDNFVLGGWKFVEKFGEVGRGIEKESQLLNFPKLKFKGTCCLSVDEFSGTCRKPNRE